MATAPDPAKGSPTPGDSPSVRRKPGTRPRGKRTPISVRVPQEQYAVYLQEAEKLGIPISSWTAIILAESQQLEIPDYIKLELQKAADRRDEDERDRRNELRMARSA